MTLVSIRMSPPPVNLKTHPSLKFHGNDGNGSVGRIIQHSISQDTTSLQVSSSLQLDNDMQFPYNSGCETPSPDELEKSGSSNQHLDR